MASSRRHAPLCRSPSPVRLSGARRWPNAWLASVCEDRGRDRVALAVTGLGSALVDHGVHEPAGCGRGGMGRAVKLVGGMVGDRCGRHRAQVVPSVRSTSVPSLASGAANLPVREADRQLYMQLLAALRQYGEGRMRLLRGRCRSRHASRSDRMPCWAASRISSASRLPVPRSATITATLSQSRT